MPSAAGHCVDENFRDVSRSRVGQFIHAPVIFPIVNIDRTNITPQVKPRDVVIGGHRSEQKGTHVD